jgi:hypothetical protein
VGCHVPGRTAFDLQGTPASGDISTEQSSQDHTGSTIIKAGRDPVWWCTPVISTLRR